MNSKLPLATDTWDEKEYQAIDRVVKSGFFTMGKEVAAFEERFSEFVGSKYCVMVNSGSSANLLAISSMIYNKEIDLKPGDEVLVPAVSWATTYYPLKQYGLKLKFVDIDIDTLNYDVELLAKAVTKSTKLIVAVNILGNPNEFDEVSKVANQFSIPIFEDNCESLGAYYKGKSAGTFGLLGSFSCYFSHHISTMEGGLIVTDDKNLYDGMISLRSHGWTRNMPKDNIYCEIGDDPFYESFRFVLPGYNLRPLEMSGALGQEQLQKLPAIIENRRQNAKIFGSLFGDIPGIKIQKEIEKSSWFGFSMICDGKTIDRKKMIEILSQQEIEFRPIIGGNFLKNPVIQYFDYEVFGQTPSADKVHDHGLFIGNHHYNIEEPLIQLKAEILKSI